MAEGFGVATTVADGRVGLALSGELDLAAVDALQAALAGIETQSAHSPVVVDLADATFIDSTVIGVLVAGWQAAKGRGVRFTVVNARGLVERVLVVTGVYAALRNPDL